MWNSGKGWEEGTNYSVSTEYCNTSSCVGIPHNASALFCEQAGNGSTISVDIWRFLSIHFHRLFSRFGPFPGTGETLSKRYTIKTGNRNKARHGFEPSAGMKASTASISLNTGLIAFSWPPFPLTKQGMTFHAANAEGHGTWFTHSMAFNSIQGFS